MFRTRTLSLLKSPLWGIGLQLYNTTGGWLHVSMLWACSAPYSLLLLASGLVLGSTWSSLHDGFIFTEVQGSNLSTKQRSTPLPQLPPARALPLPSYSLLDALFKELQKWQQSAYLRYGPRCSLWTWRYEVHISAGTSTIISESFLWGFSVDAENYLKLCYNRFFPYES